MVTPEYISEKLLQIADKTKATTTFLKGERKGELHPKSWTITFGVF